jgi:hypothetical protein
MRSDCSDNRARARANGETAENEQRHSRAECELRGARFVTVRKGPAESRPLVGSVCARARAATDPTGRYPEVEVPGGST